MEKKVEMLEVKLNTVTNNNIPSTKSVSSVSTSTTTLWLSATKCLVCGQICSDSNDLKMHSETGYELSIDYGRLPDSDKEDSTNNLSPAKPPPVTRACSPHTPPGTPPCRRSPSSVSTLVPTSAVIKGTSASTDSTLLPRTADATSAASIANVRDLRITEDYIVGINQIDLGPRVNDLSTFFE